MIGGGSIWWMVAYGLLLAMMLPGLWRAYKHFQTHGKKAEKGDWTAVMAVFAGLVLFIILLVQIVRS